MKKDGKTKEISESEFKGLVKLLQTYWNKAAIDDRPFSFFSRTDEPNENEFKALIVKWNSKPNDHHFKRMVGLLLQEIQSRKLSNISFIPDLAKPIYYDKRYHFFDDKEDILSVAHSSLTQRITDIINYYNQSKKTSHEKDIARLQKIHHDDKYLEFLNNEWKTAIERYKSENALIFMLNTESKEHSYLRMIGLTLQELGYLKHSRWDQPLNDPKIYGFNSLIKKDTTIKPKLDQLPNTVFQTSLLSYLDPKTLAILSACSSTLYQETKGINVWKDKLIKAGINPSVIEQIKKANIIQNYKTVYRTIIRFRFSSRQKLTAHELLCLSGEIAAIHYAVQSLGLTKESKGLFGSNALHWAALSGSVAAMEYAIKDLKIPGDSCDAFGRNALYYAAWSGSVEAMEYAIKDLKISADSRDVYGANALHYAAWGGSVEAMEYAIEKLKIPADSRDKNGTNALHCAAWGGSVEAMKYAIKDLKIPADSRDNNGTNALHYAAPSGSVEAMKYAIEKLKIPADSRDNDGTNALHWAALSGSVEAVKFIRRLSRDFDLKLDPLVLNNQGRDAFWYADQSGNAVEIKKILNMPIEELLKEKQSSEKQESKEDKQISTTGMLPGTTTTTSVSSLSALRASPSNTPSSLDTPPTEERKHQP